VTSLVIIHLVPAVVAAALLGDLGRRHGREAAFAYALFAVPMALGFGRYYAGTFSLPPELLALPARLLGVPLLLVLVYLALGPLALGLAEAAAARLGAGERPRWALPLLSYAAAGATVYALETTAMAGGVWRWSAETDQYFPRWLVEVPDVPLQEWAMTVAGFHLVFVPLFLRPDGERRRLRFLWLGLWSLALPVAQMLNAWSDWLAFNPVILLLLLGLPLHGRPRAGGAAVTRWPWPTLGAAGLLVLALVVQLAVVGRPELLCADLALLLLVLLGLPAVPDRAAHAVAGLLLVLAGLLRDPRLLLPVLLVGLPVGLVWLGQRRARAPAGTPAR